MKIRNRTKNKFKLIVKELRILTNNKIINEMEFNKHISSYKGFLKYGNCSSLYHKVLKN